jgi:hypothetical protein
MSAGGEKRVQAQYVSTGDPRTVSDTEIRYPGQIGGYLTTAPKTPGGGDDCFRYVLLDSTMSVAPYDGAVAWWGDREAGKVTTAATSRGRRAGIFTRAHQVSGTTRTLACFIQTGGRKSVKMIDGITAQPTAAGLYVVPSATAAKADTLAAGTAATYPALGVSAGTLDLGDSTALVDLQIEDDLT